MSAPSFREALRLSVERRRQEALDALLDLRGRAGCWPTSWVLGTFTDEDGYETTCALEIVPDEAVRS